MDSTDRRQAERSNLPWKDLGKRYILKFEKYDFATYVTRV